MNRRFILIVLIFLGAVAYFGYFAPESSGVQVGEQAPAFSLRDQSGQVISLQSLSGTPVLLNFWATWCPPCVWEMPSLQGLADHFSAQDLKVIAVSVDEQGWPVINSFLQTVPLDFTIVLDPTGEVASQYGTYQLPETYLLDANGKVLQKYIGPREWDQQGLLQEISKLLGQ